MNESADVVGVILAGGASRRMGVPKATLRIGSETLIERTIRVVQQAGVGRVLVLGGNQTWAPEATDWLPDQHPGEGPLAALDTAFSLTSEEWILLLSCDLVRLSVEALRHMFAAAASAPGGTFDAVVPVVGQNQYLHALYHRRLAVRVNDSVRQGERRLLAAVAGRSILEIDETEVLRNSTSDADTPEAFDRLSSAE